MAGVSGCGAVASACRGTMCRSTCQAAISLPAGGRHRLELRIHLDPVRPHLLTNWATLVVGDDRPGRQRGHVTADAFTLERPSLARKETATLSIAKRTLRDSHARSRNSGSTI